LGQDSRSSANDKVRELTYGRSFGYSDEGQLIGHLVIGVDILNEKVAKVP
jgi:3'-5' exoribonuclease